MKENIFSIFLNIKDSTFFYFLFFNFRCAKTSSFAVCRFVSCFSTLQCSFYIFRIYRAIFVLDSSLNTHVHIHARVIHERRIALHSRTHSARAKRMLKINSRTHELRGMRESMRERYLYIIICYLYNVINKHFTDTDKNERTRKTHVHR